MKALFPAPDSRISFEEFMAYALHDPRVGYYARQISTVGRGGDFTTTAEISPALAKAIAAWLVEKCRATGCRDVIELGPGSGSLAAAVRRQLSWFWRWRLRWHLVETSSGLRETQATRKELRNARWHASVEKALAVCEGKACLYSNEFFDAFPVRLFQRAESSWQEIYLERRDDRIVEVLCDVSELPPSTIWDRNWPLGQRVEVHTSIHQWIQSLATHWRSGAMLTIDYGAAMEGLYHRQPRGSLRAYFMQQRMTGDAIYQNIGRQDITADVNFSDLITWTSCFAASQPLQTQRSFLLPWADLHHPGDQYVIDPDGAGHAFLAWECSFRQ